MFDASVSYKYYNQPCTQTTVGLVLCELKQGLNRFESFSVKESFIERAIHFVEVS